MRNINKTFQRIIVDKRDKNYCPRGISYKNRVCEECYLVNYGMDCHNNPIN